MTNDDLQYGIPDDTIVVEEYALMGDVPLAERIPGFLKHRPNLHEDVGTGAGVTVAVLDTGVDRVHFERGDLNRVGLRQNFTSSRDAWDKHGHGSHCLGIVGADNDDGGILGMAPECDLLSGKVLSDNGFGNSGWIARGVDWARDSGADVISISIGGGFDPGVEAALKRAAEAGIVVCAAMGNSGQRGERGSHPGRSRHTFGVCNIDYNKRIARSSSSSRDATFADYGVSVLSCYTDGRLARLTGTSMATPGLAGGIALLIGYELTTFGKRVTDHQGEVFEVCKQASEDLGADGPDMIYGFGFVDLFKAKDEIDRLAAQKGITKISPDPTPAPDPPSTQPISVSGVIKISNGDTTKSFELKEIEQ